METMKWTVDQTLKAMNIPESDYGFTKTECRQSQGLSQQNIAEVTGMEINIEVVPIAKTQRKLTSIRVC